MKFFGSDDDEKKSLRLVKNIVLGYSSSSPWTVKKWAPKTDIVDEFRDKTHKSESTARNLLRQLEEKNSIQAAMQSGRRFYADATYSFSFPLAIVLSMAGWLYWFFIQNGFPPVTVYPIFLSPVFYVIIEWMWRRRQDTGICLQCGKAIDSERNYCSERCKEVNKSGRQEKEQEEKEEGGKSEIERMRDSMPVQENPLNG